MYCLETEGLCHWHSNGEATLRDIDLKVPVGSIYGFLGPNGAGKTTTLRLILGLLKTQAGTVSIFSKRLATHRLEILRAVGSLIESPSQYAHLSARENLALLQTIYQCPKSRITKVLDLVGLAHTGTKKLGEFSLGMKQRMGIAVALLHSPSLLILDEPTNGLDPNGMVEMRGLLGRLREEEGVTIFIASHLLAEMEKLITHVGIIDHGRMLFQGTMAELRVERQRVVVARVVTSDDACALRVISRHIPGARIQEGGVVLPATSADGLARINRLLVTSGLDVHELRTAGDDLETLYLSLIERGTS